MLAETMVGSGEGGSRVTSASGWRYSRISAVDSDEEGFSTSRSPSDVLAYKEVGSNKLHSICDIRIHHPR